MLSTCLLFGIAVSVVSATTVVTVNDIHGLPPSGRNPHTTTVYIGDGYATIGYFTVTGDELSGQFKATTDNATFVDLTRYVRSDSTTLLKGDFAAAAPGTDWQVVNVDDQSGIITAFLDFELAIQNQITLVSCGEGIAAFLVPASYDGHYFSIIGREGQSECAFQIDLQGDQASLGVNREACQILRNQTFEIAVRENPSIEYDSDIRATFSCNAEDSTLVLSNTDVTSDFGSATGEQFLVSVQALMYIHERDNKTAVINGAKLVGAPVSMTIEMDEVYKEFYDVFPIECSVNGYDILIQGCATPLSPVPDFVKIGVGEYRTDFNVFKTWVDNYPSSNLDFVCRLSVCLKDSCTIPPCVSQS